MKNSIFIFLIFLSLNCFGEDSLILKINVTSTFLTTDNLFNVYYINDKQEIMQFNYVDSTQRSYSNKQFGSPTLIDASNALKILVFYSDYNTVVLLDNKLAELSVIKLSNNINKNNYQPTAICKESESDFIWMYDDLSRKLIKLDESGNAAAESESFDQLFNFSIQEPRLFSVNNKLYLYTPTQGLLVFDNYANYIYTISEIPKTPDQVNDKFYLCTLDTEISMYIFQSQFELLLSLPEKNGLQTNLVGDKIFLRTPDQIAVYQVINR